MYPRAADLGSVEVQRYSDRELFWIEAASGGKHHELPVPAVFLVATNGVIQFEYVNPDYTVRAHPDVLLAAAPVSRK
jgi:peroxiredoxin